RVGAGSSDPLAACSITAKQLRGNSALEPGLRKAALEHKEYVRGTTMYPLEHNPGHGLLCTVPSR
ncbi:UNVERIFIED_CONTAM: Sialyltransferase-like protein 2, partial [Sesamum radiatum]